MKVFKKIGWFLFYWIWQAPQTLCGAVLWLVLCPYLRWANNGYTYWRNPFVNISLGAFVFVQSNDNVKHELGHQRQSWILGWLFLPFVGIASFVSGCLWLWNGCRKGVWYWKSYWTETWADWLARKL